MKRIVQISNFNIDKPPIFFVDNVMEYYLENYGETGVVHLGQCMAPPFPVFWMEGQAGETAWGAMFNDAAEIKKDICLEAKCDGLCRWVLLANIYKTINQKKVQKIPIHFSYHLDGNGIVKNRWGHCETAPSDKDMKIFRMSLDIFELAMSFMHCKNVKIKKIEPSEKLKQARERRGKPPSLTYHVLEIESMKRAVKESLSQGNDFQKALHICRGHFHEYGVNGKGLLFGKYAGNFFIPPTVRGSAKHGTVVKDYNVKPPVRP